MKQFGFAYIIKTKQTVSGYMMFVGMMVNHGGSVNLHGKPLFIGHFLRPQNNPQEKQMRFTWNDESWGITQKSFMSLRDELARRWGHRIAVLEVPTSENICGFLIVDETDGSCVFTGDGFRTDRGGEGGRGYAAAISLLRIFGFGPSVPFYPEQISYLEYPRQDFTEWKKHFVKKIEDDLNQCEDDEEYPFEFKKYSKIDILPALKRRGFPDLSRDR
jgi:hypothetical protein